MFKFSKYNSFFCSLFLLIIFVSSSCVSRDQDKLKKPAAHILMPAYNVNKFILTAIESVLVQTYPNWKLIILDDGSTDDTLKKIQQFLDSRLDLKEKIHLQSSKKNRGVSSTRTKLLKYSKRLDPQAYIFWLDADDRYVDPSFIQNVIYQMLEKKADICIFNFSISYENEKQKANAQGLVKEKEKLEKIIREIHLSPTQSINPLRFPKTLDITSIGFVKCYAPTVQLPDPLDCPFEDFVYMAALLDARTITALPVDNEPIQYLRRSGSICGQRQSKNFTDDIPNQLKKFFDTVLENTLHSNSRLQKATMAQGFVSNKLKQYLVTLETIVKTRSFPGIGQTTLIIYRKKAEAIEKYICDKLAALSPLASAPKISLALKD